MVWNKVIARNPAEMLLAQYRGGRDNARRVSFRVRAMGQESYFRLCVVQGQDDGQRREPARRLHRQFTKCLSVKFACGISEGEFVNLTHGRVYPEFDREANSLKTIKQGEPLFVGMDFNVGPP